MANEYIKSAAASLHRASNSLQQQAKDLQANLVRIRTDTSAFIDKQSLKMKSTQAEHVATSDEGQRSKLAIRIQKMQDEIMAAEKDLKQAETDLQDAVNAKITAATGIKDQAKQLENQADTLD